MDSDQHKPCAGNCGCRCGGTEDKNARCHPGTGSSEPETQSVANITVRIEMDSSGKIRSFHHPTSEKDDEVFKGWAGGGARHIAHALLTEAVRREAYVCALIALRIDPQLLALYWSLDESNRVSLERTLADRVGKSLVGIIPKLTEGSVKEVLAMMASQG